MSRLLKDFIVKDIFEKFVLEILEKEKEKLENIKKGLMQKLLTGKVRVVV